MPGRPVARTLGAVPGQPATNSLGQEQTPMAARLDRIAAWLHVLAPQIPNLEQAVALVALRGQSQRADFPSAASEDSLLCDLAERVRSAGTAQTDVGAEGTAIHIGTPIRVGGEVVGAVAVRVASLAPNQRGLVVQILGWGERWLQLLLSSENDAPELASVFPSLCVDLQAAFEHRAFGAVAVGAASAIAYHLGFERASIGVCRGGRVRLAAVSEAPDASGRSDFAQALEAAMHEAALHAEPVLQGGGAAGSTEFDAHRALAAETAAACIYSLPLRHRGQVFAVLTLEGRSVSPAPLDAATRRACAIVADLLGPALALKHLEDRWAWLRPEKGAPGWLRRRTLLGLAALALTLFLCMVDGTYRVSAPARVEGQVHRVVVAPFDGYVDSAAVRAGDLVVSGETLATLQESQLKLERSRWAAERDELSRQYRRALADRNRAEARVMEARIAQSKARLDLIDARLARTRIRAPFDGIVISGDLSRSLGAPVQRGEVLFEVAPRTGHRIVMQADERDIGTLTAGLAGHMTLAAVPGVAMPVVIDRLTSSVHTEGGRNVFIAEARLEHGIAGLRPGMEGVVKIDVGERRLVWIWTHRLVEWAQFNLWRLWP